MCAYQDWLQWLYEMPISRCHCRTSYVRMRYITVDRNEMWKCSRCWFNNASKSSLSGYDIAREVEENTLRVISLVALTPFCDNSLKFYPKMIFLVSFCSSIYWLLLYVIRGGNIENWVCNVLYKPRLHSKRQVWKILLHLRAWIETKIKGKLSKPFHKKY